MNMEEVRHRIDQRRKELNVTYQELADKLGVNKSTIQRYINGEIGKLPLTKFRELAYALDISPTYLMGLDDSPYWMPIPEEEERNAKTIPILGTIAAGSPIFAEENYDDYVAVDKNFRADFGLHVSGDSMIEASIFDGDIALIRRQNTLENGEIGAILIGDEATLKYFRKSDERIRLSAANQALLDWPRDFTPEQAQDITILGKLVAVISPRG